MTARQKYIFKTIDEILWNDWDPIGVNDSGVGRDEYQNYVSGIFKLVMEGADKVKIANRLFQLETVSIGLPGNKENCERVAQKLIDLRTG